MTQFAAVILTVLVAGWLLWRRPGVFAKRQIPLLFPKSRGDRIEHHSRGRDPQDFESERRSRASMTVGQTGIHDQTIRPRSRRQEAGNLPTLTTSQRLKEDEDRAKYQSKAAQYGPDGVRGCLGVGNQIEKCEAHDQEDDKPLDPRHIGLLILSVFTTDYSSTLLRVQVEASMLFFLRCMSGDVISLRVPFSEEANEDGPIKLVCRPNDARTQFLGA